LATHAYPLTQRGRTQAKITGEYLRARFGTPDAYYVSYYKRSRATMELMFPGVKIYEDSRLAEAQRGIWHTMTKAQIAERFPEEIDRKEREGLYHYRPWGGENWPDVEMRIHSIRETLRRDYSGKTVYICGHGAWFNLFQKDNDRFSIAEALRRHEEGTVENASVTIFEGRRIKGRPRLVMREYIIPWQGRI